MGPLAPIPPSGYSYGVAPPGHITLVNNKQAVPKGIAYILSLYSLQVEALVKDFSLQMRLPEPYTHTHHTHTTPLLTHKGE